MSDHAKFSPSGASRWMRCPGSVGLEAEMPDKDSDYSAEGTAAHELATKALQAFVDGNSGAASDPRSYIGCRIEVGARSFVVTEDMARHVRTYMDNALIYSRECGVREVEQRVYFGSHIGALDEEAFGTVDFGAVDFAAGEIQVHDFKFGMGVQVFAERNEQMMLYALGYLSKYELIGEFTKARLTIHQPRLDHDDSWTVSVDELKAFAEEARAVVGIIRGGEWDVLDWPTEESSSTGPLIPGEKQCRFCRAKATCPALRAQVNQAVTSVVTVDDFVDLTEVPRFKDVPSATLGAAMDKIELVEEFCKAVRAEVERRLLADEPVPSPQGGYKIVQGKRGNRAWKDEEAVEAACKSMRLRQDEMYTFKLKGPKPLEDLLAKSNPKRWAKLVKLYHQPEGKPSVAPMSDPRPAITKTAVLEGFDDLGEDLT